MTYNEIIKKIRDAKCRVICNGLDKEESERVSKNLNILNYLLVLEEQISTVLNESVSLGIYVNTHFKTKPWNIVASTDNILAGNKFKIEFIVDDKSVDLTYINDKIKILDFASIITYSDIERLNEFTSCLYEIISI